MNPRFNMNEVDALIDKKVIIDLMIYDFDERFIERKQMFGEIARVSESEGVVVRLHSSGHEYILPPDVDDFRRLEPGTYTLDPTGDVVVDPDFGTSIIVHLPPPEYSGPIRNELDKDADDGLPKPAK